MKNNNNMRNKFHQTARIIKRKANDDEEEGETYTRNL